MNLDEYVPYHSKYEEHENDSITKKKFIIILKVDNDLVGFYVDQIFSIDHGDPTEIVGLSPIFHTSAAIDFIKGIINFKDRLRIILNLSRIFGEVEKFRIQQDLSSLT